MPNPESQPSYRETGEVNPPHRVIVDKKGNSIEFYDDTESKGVVRYYLRNAEGELLEFIDSRSYAYGQEDAVDTLFEDIIKDFTLNRISLNEDEIEVLRRRIDKEIFTSSNYKDNISTH